jgi:hypothetical protein
VEYLARRETRLLTGAEELLDAAEQLVDHLAIF